MSTTVVRGLAARAGVPGKRCGFLITRPAKLNGTCSEALSTYNANGRWLRTTSIFGATATAKRHYATAPAGSDGSKPAKPEPEVFTSMGIASPLFKSVLEEAEQQKKSKVAPRLSSTTITSSLPTPSSSDEYVIEGAELVPFLRGDGYDPARQWTFTTGNFRTSPRKALLVARMLKGMSLTQAMIQMEFNKKRPAKRIHAMLNRAAHAVEHNYKGDRTRLEIVRSWVGKGTYLKRIKIHGRGMFGWKHRPFSHVKVLLREVPEGMPIHQKAVGSRKKTELEKLFKAFKRHDLYLPMKETNKIQIHHMPWSRKPWKYITSPKWTDPDYILIKDR